MISLIKRLFGRKKKGPKPISSRHRVSVHLGAGTSITHYSRFVRVTDKGSLHLYNLKDGSGIVAFYPAGEWRGVSVGKRCISVRGRGP